MANTNAPAGLSPVQYLNGSAWNGQGRMYCILSTDPNAYAIGDPVILGGTADDNGIPNVTLATAGTANSVTGCVLSAGGIVNGGPFADPTNLNTTIIPATKTKNYYVTVADDPNILFVIQEGGSGSALTKADIGNNFNLKSGTNSGFVSGWTLDNASAATTNTLQLQLMGLAQTGDNTFGTYAKWLVRINNHSYKAGTAGVA
jgi:hypothetical protein